MQNYFPIGILYKTKTFLPLVFLLCLSTSGLAQIIDIDDQQTVPKDRERQVTGKVLIEDSEHNLKPMPGVHVVVQGTYWGTTTDSLGNYSIKATGHDVLTFSFVSMKTEERNVGLSNQIDVVMQGDQFNLDDVVVVGHLPIRKEDLQGSVTIIKKKDFELQPVNNALTGLQGRVPGASVINATGGTNNVFVRIRGNSSINARNDPLYLFEGLPVSLDFLQVLNYGTGNAFRPQLDLSPVTIGSMEIIKDAATGSIYGSRAAKGVVLLKAPKGKPGEPTVTYSVKMGITDPMTKRYEVMDTTEYFDYLDDLAPTIAPSFENHRDILNALGIPKAEYRANTNWKDHAFRNGDFMEHQISVSGGNQKQQYHFAVGYQKTTQVIRPDWNEKSDAILSYQLQISDRLSSSFTALFSKVNYSWGLHGNHQGSVIGSVYELPPHLKPYDQNGEIIDNFAQINMENPVALASREYKHSEPVNHRVLGVADLSYRIHKNFEIKYKSGGDFNAFNERSFISGKLHFYDASNGQSNYSDVKNTTTLQEVSLNMTKNWKQHALTASGGYSYTYSKLTSVVIGGIDVPSANLNAVYNAGEIGGVGGNHVPYSLSSYFGNAFYRFKGRYFLLGTLRYDGSSKLAPARRYELFPGITAGWMISSEKFFRVPWVNKLKLYLGYGKTGNQEVPYSLTQRFFSFYGTPAGGNSYNNKPAIHPQNIGNEDLGWEITRETTAGIDFMVLGERLYGNLGVYYKVTDNIIAPHPLPPSTGFPTYLGNSDMVVENKGIELNLESVNLQSELQWTSAFNIAYNDNKILESFANYEPGGSHYWGSGSHFPSHYVYEWKGVDPETGDVTYVDQNGDDKITPEDKINVGRLYPTFFGGLQNRFQYKGFSLDVLLEFATGYHIDNFTRWALEGTNSFRNRSAAVNDRWRQPGDITDIPRADFYQNYRRSDRYIEDGSYLRLKSLSLAYQFPRLKNIKFIKGLQLFVSAQNLATLTGYSGHDPEVYFSQSNNLLTRNDIFHFPLTRTYMAGFTVGF